MDTGEQYAEVAHELVDQVLNSAVKKLESEHLLERDTSRQTTLLSLENLREDYQVKNIEWLTIEEFTIQKGEDKINDFLKTWDYEGAWLYCIDFLQEDDFEFDKRFRYRVRWSIPTRRKPIPRATASVYFTFVVSKIKPKTYPVDVYYVFETNRLVHIPGQSRFREKWLKDIIENKVLMLQAIDF
ncbi:A-kinase anchor protein 14-like [Lingula anatina]|uniref:A-kinase anchor protein 14-like n=1 Tax=Lingula anatina TaxID=7574 RepID=A0A1S3JM59_LINAN|nr:A-kinase anchor protein 14-like [Lingula anatina]|eukprot:XP_013411462.1 A-kinase anchor protein 14-like [Lingula anatina]